MNDYECAEKCAAASRSAIQSTLVQYFQLTGDAERAEERANALLNHYDHENANRIRVTGWSDDSPGNTWNWWDSATIPDSIADLIDPEVLR